MDRKKIETRLQDGSNLLQVDSQLSDNMHNIQTMNQYDGKLYYESMMSSTDGKISCSKTLVDGKEAGKKFIELKSKVINGKEMDVVSYLESDIRIPNTGKKIVFANSIEGSSDLVCEEIDDESKDIRLKYITDDKHTRTYDKSAPIFDEQGKQIGMLRTLEVYDDENGVCTKKRSEVYDGNPQLSYETSVKYGKDGIESVSKLENGKLIQSLSKNRKGQIEITALDKISGTYSHDKYLPTDGKIIVDNFSIDSDEIPDLYIDTGEVIGDGGYNPFRGYSRFKGNYEPSDEYFECDEERPIENSYFEISDELEQKRNKVDWSKTNNYKNEKINEYMEGVGRLEHDYIREQQNERRTAHNREQKDNESR